MNLSEELMTGIEKILVPKMDLIAVQQRAFHDLMNEKFKGMDFQFKALNERLDLHDRITRLEQQSQSEPKENRASA